VLKITNCVSLPIYFWTINPIIKTRTMHILYNVPTKLVKLEDHYSFFLQIHYSPYY